MTKSAKRRDRMFCHCSGLMIFFSLSDNFIKLSLIAVKSHTFVCNPTLHLHLQNTNIDSFIALNKLLPTMIYTIYVSLHRQFNLCGSLYVPLSFMLWKVFFFSTLNQSITSGQASGRHNGHPFSFLPSARLEEA